ncbi:hypothetical protein KAT51_08660 [bacterium]|nr:hypothetical protein [bacterium]
MKELKIVSGGNWMDTFIYFDGVKQDNIKRIEFEVSTPDFASCVVERIAITEKGDEFSETKKLF